MAIEKKLEAEMAIKSPADKFFKRLSREIHHTPSASSDKIHGIEVHEGDWETPGSVKLWTYTIDGKKESFKEKIEVDEEKMTVTLVAMAGHVLERYDAYRVSLQVVPEGVAGIVKITMVVLKPNEGVEDPNDYLRFVVGVVKDIDAHLFAQV